MSGDNFRYFLKEALSAFSRHKAMSAAALITMAAALGVLVLFLVVSVNVDEVVRDVEERKQIVVYLMDHVSESDTKLLQNSLEGMAGVAEVQYISRDQAWEEFRAELDDDELLEAVDTNPLPGSSSKWARTVNSISSSVGCWLARGRKILVKSGPISLIEESAPWMTIVRPCFGSGGGACSLISFPSKVHSSSRGRSVIF